jgi:hypothetical protein
LSSCVFKSLTIRLKSEPIVLGIRMLLCLDYYIPKAKHSY